MAHCDECGYVYESLAPNAIASAVRETAAQFAPAFTQPGAPDRVHVRPAPGVWSPVEYACHVRDVLLTQRERVMLALVVELPHFVPMYRDERAVVANYADESVDQVVRELEVGAALIGRLFDGLTEKQLSRRCIYNYPGPTEQDLIWLGRHTVHETKHHLADIRAGLAR